MSLQIAVNQVEYSSGDYGNVIHMFGRDKDKNPHRVDVMNFNPYFYIDAKDIEKMHFNEKIRPDYKTEYLSIRGEPLRKLYTKQPQDIMEMKMGYHHFEGDVPYVSRFMIDCNVTGGVEVQDYEIDYKDIKPCEIDAPARIATIDIECEDERGFPLAERDAIICITCYDSFTDKYTTFLLGDLGKPNALKNGCFSKEHKVHCFSHEKDLLMGFVNYITETDPDILTGWNFQLFDMPYILGRMDVFKIDASELARLPGYSKHGIRGRALFDLLEAYKKMHQQKKPSYRLDAIAFDEVGEQKVRYSGTLSNLWRTDIVKMVEYNFKDVELCVAIEKKNNIVEFYREIARYVGMPLDRTLNSSSVVDNFVLRKAHIKNFVLPSKGVKDKTDFEGATVFPPVKGIHGNVVTLDLKSLYPMSMMTVNASMETKDPDGEFVAPNGIRFKKEPDGLTRSIIMELLSERDKKKALRNQYAFGSREYLMYDMQQNVLKIIMNTYYGVSAFSGFRLFDPDVGSATTSIGRAILEFTRNIIEGEGYQVVTGDTDSCYIKLPDTLSREETIAEAKRLEALLNKKYDEFAKETLNADKHYFSTKFEKLYVRFFSGGKKKRYAGLLSWKEGKDVDEVDIVGFEARRSDTSQIGRDCQTQVITMILNGSPYQDIKDYMVDIVKRMRGGKFPLDEVGIPGSFGKSFNEYDGDDAHLRAAKYSNKYLRTSFGKASKPKRVYIKRIEGGGFPRTDVVAFEYGDQIPQNFIIDWDIMLEKTVQNPITRIVEALDWDWLDFDPTHTTLSQWGIN